MIRQPLPQLDLEEARRVERRRHAPPDRSGTELVIEIRNPVHQIGAESPRPRPVIVGLAAAQANLHWTTSSGDGADALAIRAQPVLEIAVGIFGERLDIDPQSAIEHELELSSQDRALGGVRGIEVGEIEK
jgi:hypothetical protein